LTDGATESELPFVARDGLPLVGTLFSPDGRGGPSERPTAVVVHGFGGSRTSNIRPEEAEKREQGGHHPSWTCADQAARREWVQTCKPRRRRGGREAV
jgi:hypothetical protein